LNESAEWMEQHAHSATRQSARIKMHTPRVCRTDAQGGVIMAHNTRKHQQRSGVGQLVLAWSAVFQYKTSSLTFVLLVAHVTPSHVRTRPAGHGDIPALSPARDHTEQR